MLQSVTRKQDAVSRWASRLLARRNNNIASVALANKNARIVWALLAKDGSASNTAALAILNADKPDEESITIRQNKYLNNLVEQDHRNIKRRTRPMLGFKSFGRARCLLAGIELVNMIRKGQLDHPAGEGLSPAEQFYLLAA